MKERFSEYYGETCQTKTSLGKKSIHVTWKINTLLPEYLKKKIYIKV